MPIALALIGPAALMAGWRPSPRKTGPNGTRSVTCGLVFYPLTATQDMRRCGSTVVIGNNYLKRRYIANSISTGTITTMDATRNLYDGK